MFRTLPCIFATETRGIPVLMSMTGYGRAEKKSSGLSCTVEARSVNGRFLEVISRLPRPLTDRENDLKEITRTFVSRGKVTVAVVVERDSNGQIPLSVNAAAARSYFKLLNQLRKAVKIREQVKLEHLLKFSEVLEASDEQDTHEETWSLVRETLKDALKELNTMRQNEGGELAGDLEERILEMGKTIDRIEEIVRERIPEERKKLEERINRILSDKALLDQGRLELEIALLADKLDVTEECVRYRSHNKFFLDAIRKDESAGRKLNFLVQEMNREANTIGSKTNDADVSHLVVRLKEELEKIREQLQNIE